jgi:hypothetical protein
MEVLAGIPKSSRNATTPDFPCFSSVNSTTDFDSATWALMPMDLSSANCLMSFSNSDVVLSGGVLGPVINESRSLCLFAAIIPSIWRKA